MTGALDPRYVLARRILLDTLDALGAHKDSVVLIGAQAVYARTGAGELQVTPFTEDADLALDPRQLDDEPHVEVCMERAGFVRGENPGDWRGPHDTHVDLMVPDALSLAGGRRGARIPPHASFVARRVAGLEACVVDFSLETIRALDPADTRAHEIRIAGAAALLVAKAFKLGERSATSVERVQPKDALDIYRLLMAVPMNKLVERFDQLSEDPVAGDATRQAVRYLEALFASLTAEGPELVAQSLAGTDQPQEGREISHRLAQMLLQQLRKTK